MAKLIEVIKNNKKDIIIPITVLLAICIVIPLALSLTNKVTAGKIAQLETKNQKQTMSRLIKADKFDEKSLKNDDENTEYYIAKTDGEIKGYIFITASKGYGGEVSVMTAINTDGTVKSVAILDVSNETPGLGQNASKENFYSQYKEKTAGVSLVKNSADSEKNEVNAVTGATITSKAVTAAVNEALKDFETVNDLSGSTTEGEVQDNEK